MWSNQSVRLAVAAAAAFCTYFCMYAFRKPFSAGTYEDLTFLKFDLKAVLVLSQLCGYMLSKFIGIRVISEMPRRYRAISIVGLIVFAELALVGFAFAPLSLKIVMLFLNGLPLGMIFGLVLAYLEGRKQTEALSAALCASFIISSGVVKSVGRWLIDSMGVSEFMMPMLTGLIFLPPLFLAVWILDQTPSPDDEDIQLRSKREEMDRVARSRFIQAYWPGISLMVFVYMALTVIRTIRDDYGVEIWRDLGVEKTPSIFAQSETVVALIVIVLNALAMIIRDNLRAMRIALGFMSASFALLPITVILSSRGAISPFTFMVACGVCLYIPYVAFHTTAFERFVAASKHPANLGFLMYIADALGYLTYAAFLGAKTWIDPTRELLPFFYSTLWGVSISSIVALIGAIVYFQYVFHEGSHTSALTPEVENTE